MTKTAEKELVALPGDGTAYELEALKEAWRKMPRDVKALWIADHVGPLYHFIRFAKENLLGELARAGQKMVPLPGDRTLEVIGSWKRSLDLEKARKLIEDLDKEFGKEFPIIREKHTFEPAMREIAKVKKLGDEWAARVAGAVIEEPGPDRLEVKP